MKKKIKIELAPIIIKDDEKISEQRSSSMMHLKIRRYIQHKKENWKTIEIIFLGFSSGEHKSPRIVHTWYTPLS